MSKTLAYSPHGAIVQHYKCQYNHHTDSSSLWTGDFKPLVLREIKQDETTSQHYKEQ